MSLFGKKDPQKNPQGDSSTTNPELTELEARAREECAAPVEAPQIENAPPSMPIDKGMCGLFWKTLFKVVARNKGDHWNLEDEEIAHLGEVSVPIAEKWLPAVMNKYGAEAMLASALIFVIVPRFMKGPNEKDGRGDSDPGKAGFGQVNAGFPTAREQHV